MNQLKTNFAGLQLKNPVIISSSGLTNSAAKNKKLEDAGAGAIVLKSLFEEQIMLQVEQMQDNISQYPESEDYLNNYIRSHQLSEYINLIQESKAQCTIPIIASINCYTNNGWADFAHKIELAGADALEINILAVQTSPDYQYGEFEQRHIDILRSVKKHVNIPVIVKLGANLTNPVALITQLHANGASAVVLFNRFYQPDINIDKMEYTSGEVFSTPADLSASLRWIGISSARVDQIDYIASGGVHNGEGIIKAILAGASAVEICSVLYMNGNGIIREMQNRVESWMHRNGYEQISQFKGLMNAKNIQGINMFERTQFLKYFGSKE